MGNNWWDKFLDLFTEEVGEREEIPHNTNYADDRNLVRNEILRQDRRPGRIEEMHRPVQPRMISQYPQRGKAQGPIIDDRRGQIPRKPRMRQRQMPETVEESDIRKRRERRRSSMESQRSIERQIPEEGRKERSKRDRLGHQEKIREKFTGVDFRASDVPSPVYGFRKRSKGLRRQQDEVPEELKPVYPSNDFAEGSLEPNWNRQIEKEEEYFIEEAETKLTDDEETNELVSEQSTDLNALDEEAVGEFVQNEAQKRDSYEKEPPEDFQKEIAEPYIETTRTSSPPPYNVMMLKSDRLSSRDISSSKGSYRLPPLNLLAKASGPSDEDEEWIDSQRLRLAETLQHFNVNAKVTGYTKGPAVTRFEVTPAPGEKVSKIKKLNDDLKLSLAVKDIRIEAPIPGTNSVGIEIPNRTSQPVYLREMIESPAFQESDSPLTAALGRDITGRPIVTDLRKMPHGLIGGATGSGKSVCINSLLISLLYKASPDEVKFILIDPKVVELAPFKEIPHLAAPVINDAKEAALALKWAVEEMERRYGLFVDVGARDIARYNSRSVSGEKLPFIVIVIDELADLMMAAPHDVEESICRIAQKARACGIHLVLATQRPSVDVITGLIKANIPTRLAFSVSAQADSRTILDMGGAEKLLG
ncbi:MAG TPA: DNA translocase FtsK, partial [Bacillales bacterium]|nr:DNA translocase FtsK [Bacillales bacterium]